MATEIEESILAALMTTLATVTVANGYEVTIAVERADEESNVPADLKVVVSAGDLREVNDEDRGKAGMEVPLMHDGYLLPIEMTVYRAQSATNPDAALSKASAAIRKAVKANYTHGGLVENIFWKPQQKVFVGTMPGILMSYEAFYYTAINNPYSQ